MVEKVVRDGKVAVIVSRGYGSGWSTVARGNNVNVMLFHPKLVELIESKGHHKMDCDSFEAWMTSELGITDEYLGGWDGLEIQWIPQGTRFKIDEYDGAETILTEPDLRHTA